MYGSMSFWYGKKYIMILPNSNLLNRTIIYLIRTKNSLRQDQRLAGLVFLVAQNYKM